MPIKVDLTALPQLTNNIYYPLYSDQNRYLVLYGGAGSGKSVFAAQKWLVRLLSERGHRILVVRKVAKTLRNSVFAQLRELIGQWDLVSLFTVNKSDLEIACVNGNQFIFMGLDDVEKLKSIVGITGIWIEEASELTREDFMQLDLRLRGYSVYYKQVILTFNPISVLNWLKKYFFDVARANATILKTTYRDNRFTDPQYAQVIEGLKDQDYVYYQVYALGEWGVLGNLILTKYVVEDIPTADSAYSTVYLGLDFGFNDPSVYLKIGVKDDELYVFHETYERRLTNPELIEKVKPVHPANAIVMADSAEPDRIKEFQQAGFSIQGVTKGKDSVKAGLDFLRRKRIHIHSDCVHTIAEIQGYKYREDKDGNVFDEPVDFNNHCMDALRYGIEPYRLAGRTSPISSKTII